MNEDQKNIEKCLSEQVGAEIVNAATGDKFDALVTEAWTGEQPAQPYTSWIVEFKSLLILLLRKLYYTPLSLFSNTSIKDFIAGLQSTIVTLQAAIASMLGDIATSYQKVSEKGGTLPQEQTSANLPTAIESIPSGGGIIRCSEFNCYGYNNDQFDTGSIYLTAKQLYRNYRDNNKLTEIDCSHWVLNSQEMYSMYQVFAYCTNVEVINLTGAVLNFRYGNNATTECFLNCIKVRELDLRGINVPSGASLWDGGQNMFNNCSSLKVLRMSSTWRFSFSVRYTGLEHDGLVQLFDDLPTITTPQTITIGANKQALLSQAEMDVIINKGWQLA